jgi:hypothetical protein
MAVEDKPDCVFYGRSASSNWTELAVDLSQNGLNLTAGTLRAFELDSARANHYDRRTVVVRFAVRGDDEGYLFVWRRGSSANTSHMRVTQSGGTSFLQISTDGGTTTRSITLNTTLTPIEYIVAWTMYEYPDTAATQTHELHVIALGTPNTAAFYRTTLPAETVIGGNGDITFGAFNSTTVAAEEIYSNFVLELGLFAQAHSAAETWDDYGASSPKSAPTLAGERRNPSLVPARLEVPIGDQGEFSGPAHLFAAHAARNQRSLAWGPVVAAKGRDISPIPDLNADLVDARRWWVEAPWVGSGYRMRMEYLFYRPTPPGANRVLVTAVVRHISSGGSSNDPIELAAISMSQPGPGVRPDTSPSTFERYWATGTAAHGTGRRRVVFAPVRVALDSIGWSYFTIAARANAEDLAWRILDITIEPIFDASSSGLGTGGLGA